MSVCEASCLLGLLFLALKDVLLEIVLSEKTVGSCLTVVTSLVSKAKTLEDEEEKEEEEELDENELKEDADEMIGEEFIFRTAGLLRSLPTELYSDESFDI